MAESSIASSVTSDLQSAAEEYEKIVSSTRSRVDEDGVVYEWDSERRGWFPKIDADFIAYYQASYGAGDEAGTTESTPTSTKGQSSCQQDDAKPGDLSVDENTCRGNIQAKKPQPEKRKAQSQPEWFDMDPEKNNNVYVTGLPLDTSEQEFFDFMSKCGIVMEDEDTLIPKIKLYRDENGVLKGDARCCYLKHESVILAEELLDGSFFRDCKIQVEQAVFERKGDFNPALRKKKKKKKKKNQKSAQEKLLDWRERASGPKRMKHEKIVIFKHVFVPEEFDEDATLITEIRDDIQHECEKCGPVHKVMVFDRHPDGVVSVSFKEFEAADNCIAMMNGRWFGGRQLLVEVWDGVVSYQIEETEKEHAVRMKKWEEFLDENQTKSESAADGAQAQDDCPHESLTTMTSSDTSSQD